MDALIILAALCPIFYLLPLTWTSFKRGDRILGLFYGFTLFGTVLRFTYPLVFAVLNNYRYERLTQTFSNAGDLARVAVGEAVFLALSIGLFACFAGKIRNRLPGFDLRNIRKSDAVTATLILIFGSQIYFGSLIGATGVSDDSIKTPYLVQFFGTSCILLTGMAVYQWNNAKIHPPTLRLVFFLSGILLILIMLALFAVLGIRGRLIYIGQGLLLMSVLYGRYRAISVFSLILVMLLPFFGFMGSTMREVVRPYLRGDVAGDTTVSEIAAELAQEKRSLDTVSSSNLLVRVHEAGLDRFAGPRNSIALYKLYDSNVSLGYYHLLGSVFYPVPRAIWRQKPLPNSIAYAPRSSAQNIAMQETYGGFMGYRTGPYLVSSHAYWEGGYWGIVFSAVFSACVYLVVVYWGSKVGGFIGLNMIFGMMLIQQGDPFLSMQAINGGLIGSMWKLLFIPSVILFSLSRLFHEPFFQRRRQN
jgi:hypothetical protein